MVNGEPDCLELSFVSFVAAILPGFSLNKAEQRCGICGALGHLGCSAALANSKVLVGTSMQLTWVLL